VETRGGPRRYGAILLALACWARFLTGTDEQGEAIPLEDPAAVELSAAARTAREKPAAFLRAIRMPELEEGELEALAGDFAFRLGRIYTLGVRGALEELVRPTR
jgi:mannitol-1-phosphate/altronate dehydrogenase